MVPFVWTGERGPFLTTFTSTAVCWMVVVNAVDRSAVTVCDAVDNLHVWWPCLGHWPSLPQQFWGGASQNDVVSKLAPLWFSAGDRRQCRWMPPCSPASACWLGQWGQASSRISRSCWSLCWRWDWGGCQKPRRSLSLVEAWATGLWPLKEQGMMVCTLSWIGRTVLPKHAGLFHIPTSSPASCVILSYLTSLSLSFLTWNASIIAIPAVGLGGLSESVHEVAVPSTVPCI